jgi:hypothetical protein
MPGYNLVVLRRTVNTFALLLTTVLINILWALERFVTTTLE